MHLSAYLHFNGNCEAAFKFYEKVLRGKIETMMTNAGSPAEAHVPAEWKNKILHVSMKVGDSVLMGSDAPPGHFKQPQGFSVSIQLNEPAEADRIFNELSESGTITMPIEKTFWATRFGILVDRFGIPWMVNCG